MIKQPIWFIPVGTAFLVLSSIATYHHGYLGIFEAAFQDTATLQVFADLCVALSFAMTWLYRDARKLGLNPWPWFIGTLFLGSIAPLGYLGYRRWAGAPAEEQTWKTSGA